MRSPREPILTAAAMALVSACGGSTPSASRTPRLHTEGRSFKDPDGNVVILRGVALADLHDVDLHRAPPYDVATLIDLVSDASQGWYARVVRLIVFPALWNADPDDYLENHLKPAVARAAARGVYAIVDWHEITDALSADAETRAFWTRVAPVFAGDPHVLYELFNEPVDFADPSWSTWKANAQPWVDLVRREAPDTVLLIGGPEFDEQIEGAATDPLLGSNLAYVAHIYPTVAPALWSAGGPFERVAAARPLVITEWGYSVGSTGLAGDRASFGDPLKAFIERAGASWTAFCADTDWTPAMFDGAWNLRVGPGEMGGFTRDWLAETKDLDQPGGGRNSGAGGSGTDAGGSGESGGAAGGAGADAAACGGEGQPCCGVDGICNDPGTSCTALLGGTCVKALLEPACDGATPCPTGELCTVEGVCRVDCSSEGGACPSGRECTSTPGFCAGSGCDGGTLRACMPILPVTG